MNKGVVVSQKIIDKFCKTAGTLLSKGLPNHFLLFWEGSKIPRGAYIDDYEITWTQHGIVQGARDVPEEDAGIKIGGNMSHLMRDNRRIGYYSRLEEFGGRNHRRQVMLISTEGKDIKFPDGQVLYLPPKPEGKLNVNKSIKSKDI